MKMKMTSKNIFRPAKKILAMSLSAITATLVSTSTTTYASDIDIYQQARSGDITLMMLFDISGSMGAPQLIGDADACDIPSGKSVANSDSSASGTTPSYTRYYCNVLETKKYKYRYDGGWRVSNRWSACRNEAENRNDCSWGTAVSTQPNNLSGLLTETSGNYTYYFEGYTREYPDRLTRI